MYTSIETCRLILTCIFIFYFRIGHQIPMITGCGFNLAATLGFAYLMNYYLLVLARGLQALGSSLSVVGGKK